MKVAPGLQPGYRDGLYHVTDGILDSAMRKTCRFGPPIAILGFSARPAFALRNRKLLRVRDLSAHRVRLDPKDAAPITT